MLALVLSASLSTVCCVFWAALAAGWALGYAHRGLVGCRPLRWPAVVWRWWARVTWRLLIGRQDPHAGWYVDRGRVPSVCGPEYPSFTRVR
jgi:hypothetical protein